MSQAFFSIVDGTAVLVLGAGILGTVRALWRHHQDHEDTRQHLSEQDDRLERIEAEFYPNGGTSQRDAIDDLLAAVTHLAREQGVRLPPGRSRPKGHR